MKLHNTLTILNPDLAHLVRSFHHSLRFADSKEREIYWGHLSTTFRNMVNLKCLTVYFGSSTYRVPLMTTIFRGCKFQLEEFRWTRSGFDLGIEDTIEDDKSSIEFLSTQREIRRLGISMPNWNEEVSPTLCPQLEMLEGDGSTIQVFLRGRSTITELCWAPEVHDPHYASLDSCATELAFVRILSLGGYYPRPALGLLTPHLTRLEELCLSGWGPRNVDLITELEGITSLQKLRVFAWSPGRFMHAGVEAELRAQGTQRGLVERWFRVMPMLCSACFCMDRTMDSSSYLLWKRGEVEPVVTDRIIMAGRR
ncbi:hypothetical protein P691DRAFT_776370 [Macrolepiota fuliginosa MF-IS2]|uniref:Uncharacterized protein n=1 Tax=Macrolepiota fuliginosa MF-IS2 TaxID=1400762 RepID=A0A9P6C348_9AGAR|nr:hypothetical protein P691DRAFT_776370 [Macrolepiota fuliginosa MF-IS2]